MTVTNRRQTIPLRLTIAVAFIAACAVNSQPVFSGDGPSLRNVTAVSIERTANARQQTIRLILHRQKGDQLNVYLNSRGGYVNGKSVSHSILDTIAGESGMKVAVLTVEPYLSQEKIDAWNDVLHKAGITNIKQAIRTKQVNKSQEKVREILHRQKDDTLKVFLKSPNRIYINGKSVSSGELQTIVKKSGLRQVTLTSQPHISCQRIAEVKKLIRHGGDKTLSISAP